MPTRRVTRRIVMTLRLSLAAGILFTILYGMHMLNKDVSHDILVLVAIASIVFFCSCVYHVVQLIKIESQRYRAPKPQDE